MQKKILSEADRYFARKRRQRNWMKVVGALSCAVVFCTAYALILPAVTMENTSCGLEEHTHTEECYAPADPEAAKELVCSPETLGIHVHSDDCYDSDGNVICGYADFAIHTHDSLCYDPEGNLICTFPEVKSHAHTEECYEAGEEIIVTEGHEHTDACYTEEQGDLICGQEESEGHTHDDTCYENGSELTCGLEETEGHTHGDDCYEKEKVLTCEKEEQEEEREKTEDELICEEQEIVPHTHTEACYTDGALTCGRMEILEHQHTKACFRTEEISEEQRVLICEIPEHTHTEECRSIPEEDADIPEDSTVTEDHKTEEEELTPGEGGELSYTGSDYTVLVQYGPESGLPEGVTLEVREIPAESTDYQSYYEQAVKALAEQNSPLPETLVFARFFDIQFLLDGEKLEPEAPVSVKITYTTPVENDETANCQTIHFAEDGPELLNADREDGEEGETSFTHTQDSFSVVGNLVTMSYSENGTDIGPSVLPVDYYVYIDNQWTWAGTTRTGWYGDYTAAGWTNENRDCITAAQANSVLEPYGFDMQAENAALQLAYQRKETDKDANLHCDTQSYTDAEKGNVIPLARNASASSGYNLYYLPGNTNNSLAAALDKIDTANSRFYTVKVYDLQGKELQADIVKEGSSFLYTDETGTVFGWLVAYGADRSEIINGSTVSLQNITTPVVISPKQDGDVGSHSVSFKACIDGEWQTVGTLPYYYSGEVSGSQRAYITSDMAARFFGAFGYDAAENPGYHFGYSYDDIYQLYYDNGSGTGYCMDINGGNIAENEKVQLWTANTSDAQVFRIRDAGEGYRYITPVNNSSLHVNISGGGSANGTKLVLHSATDGSSKWKMQPEGNDTVSFWSMNAPDSACIDLDSGNVAAGVWLQIWDNGSNRRWKPEQRYRISNDTVSERNSDGTYKIGLTEENNGDIVCYYLPGETANRISNASESDLPAGNNVWSVSVRDDNHLVYTDGELENMRKAFREGTTAEMTVWNDEGVLWSCVGKGGTAPDAEQTQSGGYTTFRIKNIDQPVEIVATKVNPAFTVQYYANIPRPVAGGDAQLEVIDTSGRNLPKNGGSMAKKQLGLQSTGTYTDKNNGKSTELYEVKMEVMLTRLYTEETFAYEYSPELHHVDKLAKSESYKMQEIWVLKDGKDSASENRDDWEIYPYSDSLSFTNEAGRADQNTILIADGAVLRLVYDTNTTEYHNDTTFYDYNISSGQNADGSWRTGIAGINGEGNYEENNHGESWKDCRNVLAFGNANCGTGMSSYLFDGGTLNKYNSMNENYGGCTFGLVTRLNRNDLIYNDWIMAPKLFHEGDASGKQTYSNSSLTFKQIGDTYILSAATLNNSNGKENTIDGLQYFNNPSPNQDKIHTHIFTNNFWPMDEAAGRTDPLFGAYGKDVKYAGFADEIDPVSNPGWPWTDKNGNFPLGDDGRDHNCFFGMDFSISFTLTKDYVGPLEYYFFGDDDMWVFLDGQLICDIGGVHSSIGEYVNLWDYIPQGESTRVHRLNFFYTERGASGSTCYMNFTLPTVTSSTESQDTGSLRIGKKVDDPEGADFSEEEFAFQIVLKTEESGETLDHTFSYHKNDGTFGTVKSGGIITLKDGQFAEVNGIPAGTYYLVTEQNHAGYKTTANGTEGYITSGTIATGEVKTADFVNTPYYELPSTGGTGTFPYTAGGIAVMAGALLYNANRRRRRGR